MSRPTIRAALLALSLTLTAPAAAALGASGSSSAAQPLAQGISPAASAGNLVAGTPAGAPVELEVGLQLGDPAGAEALEREVSNPTSASYRRFLTPAQWERRFSPKPAAVEAVSAWLREQGIAVDGVSPDRMAIEASAPAATVERAFGTHLGQYRQGARVLRLSSGSLSVPSAIAPLISGVSGVDQTLATPASRAGVENVAPAKAAGGEIPQPTGFRNARPCSGYYGERLDTADPAYGDGYPAAPPYAVCGYVPAQLQGAYGLSAPIAAGDDGKGVTVAVVDAYASPTLFADAHEYSVRHQPSAPLESAQFGESLPKSYGSIEACEASEWFGEQTLDVEAVHATAPGAKILYVGAKNCEGALFKAVREVVDGHLADVITDSWGDDGGDLFDSAGTRRSFDNVLLMAAGTGIGVQFSSGDEGDEFVNFGTNVAGYPPSSPYVTAVGGTSLQVGAGDERLGELGWSTSQSALCSTVLQEERYPGCRASARVGTWRPPAPGEYLYGSGGSTSYEYAEPAYQEGVVPSALALRNSSVTHVANRVEPDVSMDADPTTGMLVGETQRFPDGTYYDEYRIGGTSLSSPLFAGVMADADQAAGGPLGFANPLLYQLARTPASYAGAFRDIVPASPQDDVRVDYLDGVDAAEGTITTTRTLTYEGREKFCGATRAKCTHQDVALETAPGFDSMTGLGSPGPGLLAALAAP